MNKTNKFQLLFFFIAASSFFSQEFISFNPNNTIISKENSNSKEVVNNLFYNKKFYDYTEKNKNNHFIHKYNNSCFPTEKKLFWNNETDLHINKLIEEIKNSNLFKINFKDKNKFYKREKPKISIIITVYNQGNYLKKLYSFIQKQELKDIEIIFIDDASTDNSSFIIKELMQLDKRIVYLKNHINKKQYYSINVGILNSKGEYILSIDPDDLLLNNILIKAYETAKYYNLDIIQFYMLFGLNLWRNVKYKNGIICDNKNVRKIFYYGVSRNLPDKLIKRSIYIKSIQFMKKELYNMDYHMHTDDTIFFGIIHYAKSYGFLEQIGYYYNRDPSRKKQYIKENPSEKANNNLKSLFNIMKYFILQSDNNTIEKNNIPYKFFELKVQKYITLVIKVFHFNILS